MKTKETSLAQQYIVEKLPEIRCLLRIREEGRPEDRDLISALPETLAGDIIRSPKEGGELEIFRALQEQCKQDIEAVRGDVQNALLRISDEKIRDFTAVLMYTFVENERIKNHWAKEGNRPFCPFPPPHCYAIPHC